MKVLQKLDHQFIVFRELSSEVILGMDFFKAVSGTLSISEPSFHSLQPLVPLSDYESQKLIDFTKEFPDVFNSKLGLTCCYRF